MHIPPSGIPGLDELPRYDDLQRLAARHASGGAELDPLFLTAVRAAIAALLALCALLITRQARPTRADLPPLLFVALGVVIGFPLLTALALQHTTSAHSLVYIGLLPLATAGFGVLRGGERPKPALGLSRCA